MIQAQGLLVDEELENLVLKTDKKGAIRFKGWTTWNVETVQ